MQVAVGENDEAAVLGTGVAAGLLLADQRTLVLGFGFKNDEGEVAVIEQQEIDVARAGFLEIIAQPVQVGLLERDACFQANVGSVVTVGEETPAGGLKQFVYLDACGCFFHCRSGAASAYLNPS